MESVIGIVTFIAIAFGALTGLWLARHLPKTHLSSESRTAVSVSMAVVGAGRARHEPPDQQCQFVL
jgi:hypothetical protein